jgi:membrane protease YdiL (CAAX protease family)
MPGMSQAQVSPPRNSKLMRLYLLAAVAIVVPIALSYGIAPANVLPRFLNITVDGTDQTQIFRAMMCLYLGASAFWAAAAFKPAWQRVAVIWAVIFALSLALGRMISLIVDGPASPLLDIYLVVELLAGFLGIGILEYERRRSR